MSQTQPQISVELVDGPLSPGALPRVDGAGAVILFEGVVRRQEAERELALLRYEAYEPMTSTELRRLAAQVAAETGLLAMQVTHSVGDVPVGACSFRLVVASAHRKAALQAMDLFIDLLKREAPLWKVPVYRDAPGPVEPS